MVEMSLTQGRVAPAPEIAVTAQMRLRTGRAHELCGAARRRLAVMAAAQMRGPVLWVRPGWMAERVNPDGMLSLMDPARLIQATPARTDDVLWCTEEALRSGAVPLVVAELPTSPGMTAVRRLHLAAEQCGAAVLGLLLTPGRGGAAGVESRWSLTPAHGTAGPAWRLERLRARMAPPATWELTEAALSG